jgi:hypothetical protein
MGSAFSAILAQRSGAEDTADTVILFIELAVAILAIVGMWKTFTKAGQPGWAVIVPIYNLLVLMRVAGRSPWWVLLCFIPLVNIVVWIQISLDVARKFGKGAGFGVGLALLSFIFYLILGFGDAKYRPVT